MVEKQQPENAIARSETGAVSAARRRFLVWLGRGSLAAALAAGGFQAIRFLSYEPPSSEVSIISLGTPDTFRRGSMTYVREARAYVGHDPEGLYAIDAVCPHLGCLVEKGEEGGFVCPCHDSLFSNDGAALSGPATDPLRFLRLVVDQESGQLVVDRSESVDPVTRLVV
jgi:Rieske Fe-S protein